MEWFIASVVVVGILIFVAIKWRKFLERLDRIRVREYLDVRGCRFIDMEATAELPIPCGEYYERDYRLVYEDREGNAHDVCCRTSMWSGVYFTDDRLQQPSQPPSLSTSPSDDWTNLREENQRLGEELGRLRRRDA